MAEQNGQEKTEQPTSKRRRDARKKGQVFQSKDIATVVMLFGVFWMMKIMMPHIYTTVRSYMVWLIGAVGTDMELFPSGQLFFATARSLLKCVLPLLLTTALLGIISHGAQTRFNVSFESLKPDFSKLNPLSGIKKLFSLKKLVDIVKDLIKITLLLVLLKTIFQKDIVAIARMIDMSPLIAATYMMKIAFNLVVKVCMAFSVVAFFDFLYQRWQHEQDLKMTKQEVKDEFKQTEGNPAIKGRIRNVQRQMAMSRMMQKVPQADVIIRNPTHYAVALKYDPNKNGAPIVLAKGQDQLALRIIKVGAEHDVFITENKPLARALYAAGEIDREIPAELYGAVAEILVYLYQAGHRKDMESPRL
ncbi:MAG: flagellar biosynthesis protein FlhB [Lachnospiraceae bacterium]